MPRTNDKIIVFNRVDTVALIYAWPKSNRVVYESGRL